MPKALTVLTESLELGCKGERARGSGAVSSDARWVLEMVLSRQAPLADEKDKAKPAPMPTEDVVRVLRERMGVK